MTRVALKAFLYSNPHDSWAVRRALQHVELNADEEFNSNEKCCFRCIRFRVGNVFWDLQDFSIKKWRLSLFTFVWFIETNQQRNRSRERTSTAAQNKTIQFASAHSTIFESRSRRCLAECYMNNMWEAFVRSACQAFNAEGVGFWLISLLINAFVAFLIPPYRSATTNRGF